MNVTKTREHTVILYTVTLYTKINRSAILIMPVYLCNKPFT